MKAEVGIQDRNPTQTVHRLVSKEPYDWCHTISFVIML